MIEVPVRLHHPLPTYPCQPTLRSAHGAELHNAFALDASAPLQEDVQLPILQHAEVHIC